MTTKRDLVRLAFEELGVSAYAGGLAAPLYVSGGSSPTRRQVFRLAFQELGVAPYNDGVPSTEFVSPSGPTVQEVIDKAYGEAGQSPLKDAPDAEEYDYALGQLRAMLAEWKQAKGLELGFDPTAMLNDPSGLDAAVTQVVALALAVRLSILNGRAVSDDTRKAVDDGIASLFIYYNAKPGAHLNAMMAEWLDSYGIDLGFTTNVDTDEPCGIPQGTLQVVSIGLAMRIAPLVGKELSEDSKGLYGAAFGNLRAFYSSSPYRRLDAMMQEWYAAYGLDLGYTFTDPPAADDIATIPPGAEQVVATSLALRLAPALGKQVSPETRKAQAEGFSSLRVAYLRIPTMQLGRNTVAGAGNRHRWSPYFQPRRDLRSIVEPGFPIYEDGVEIVE